MKKSEDEMECLVKVGPCSELRMWPKRKPRTHQDLQAALLDFKVRSEPIRSAAKKAAASKKGASKAKAKAAKAWGCNPGCNCASNF